MGVSKNRGTPKSSILIGFSLINHPFWGTIIFGNTHISDAFNLGGYSQEILCFCWHDVGESSELTEISPLFEAEKQRRPNRPKH